MKPHGGADFLKGIAGGITGVFTTFLKDGMNKIRIALILPGPLMERSLFLDNCIDQWLLAVQATDARAATACLDPFLGIGVGIDLVHAPHWALLWLARIGSTHPLGIGLHGADFLGNAVRLFPQADIVVV